MRPLQSGSGGWLTSRLPKQVLEEAGPVGPRNRRRQRIVAAVESAAVNNRRDDAREDSYVSNAMFDIAADDGSERRSDRRSEDSDGATSRRRTDTATSTVARPSASGASKRTSAKMGGIRHRLAFSFATNLSTNVPPFSSTDVKAGAGTSTDQRTADVGLGRVGTDGIHSGRHASTQAATGDDIYSTETDATERATYDRERETFQQVHDQSALQTWWFEAATRANQYGWTQLLDGGRGYFEGVLCFRRQQTDAGDGVCRVRRHDLSSAMRRNGVLTDPEDLHGNGGLYYQTPTTLGPTTVHLHRRHRTNTASGPRSVDEVAIAASSQCFGIVWFLDFAENRYSDRDAPSGAGLHHRFGSMDGNGSGRESGVDSDASTTDGDTQADDASGAIQIGGHARCFGAGSTLWTFNDVTNSIGDETIFNLGTVQFVDTRDEDDADVDAGMDSGAPATVGAFGRTDYGTGGIHSNGIGRKRLGQWPRNQQRRDALGQMDVSTSGESASQRHVERKRIKRDSDRAEQSLETSVGGESEQNDGGSALVFGQLDGGAGFEETRPIEIESVGSNSDDDSASLQGAQRLAGADMAAGNRAGAQRPRLTADRETYVVSIEQGVIRTPTSTAGENGRRFVRVVRDDAATDVREPNRSTTGTSSQLRGGRRIYDQMAEVRIVPPSVTADQSGIEQSGGGQSGESSIDSTILADVGILDERDPLLDSGAVDNRRSVGRAVRSLDDSSADRANSGALRRTAFMLQRLREDGLDHEEANLQLEFVESRLKDKGRSYDACWRWYVAFVRSRKLNDTSILTEAQLAAFVHWLESQGAPVRRIMSVVQATYSVSSASRFSVQKGTWIQKAVLACEKRRNRAEVNPTAKRAPFDYRSVFAQLRALRMEDLELERLRAILVFLWQWSTVARTTNLANIFYEDCREALPEETNGRPALIFCVKESFIKGHEEPIDGLMVDRDASLDLWQWDNEYQSRLLRLGIRQLQHSGRRGVQFGRFLSLKPTRLVGNSWVHTSLGAERIASCVKSLLESLGVPHPLSRAHNVCRTAVTAASALGVPVEAIQNGRWTNPVTMHRVYDQTMPRIATMAPELFVRQKNVEESETDSEADRTPLLEIEPVVNTEPIHRSLTDGGVSIHQSVEQQSSVIPGDGSVESVDEEEQEFQLRSRRDRSVMKPKRFRPS